MGCRGEFSKARGALSLAAFLLAGCGQDAPPYDGLPLRDALRAAPEVVATMSFETRRDLAKRFDTAGFDAEDVTTFELPEMVTIDGLSRIADDAREDQGQDALIFGTVIEQKNDFVLQGEDIGEQTLDLGVAGPIALRGTPSTQTEALEDAALRGRAGVWLRELSERTQTNEMVRTTGLPFGAWAHGDKLYVNASWLVAMSALEENTVMVGGEQGALFQGQAPKKNPLSVDHNPYKLPETIAECAAQVQATCACGTSCSHEVTDPSFANANEECAWVNQDLSRPAALCILALLDIDDVRACMESASGQCSAMPVSTRDDAVVFAQNITCLDLLDICLRDGYIPEPSTGGSGSSCNGSDSGSGGGCSNSNGGCSKCNDDCSKCNDNWSDCNDNCSNTGSNANSCGRCSLHRAEAQSPIPAPMGSGFWLVAPAAYLLLRGRRRS